MIEDLLRLDLNPWIQYLYWEQPLRQSTNALAADLFSLCPIDGHRATAPLKHGFTCQSVGCASTC
jgi:hypothetical protein